MTAYDHWKTNAPERDDEAWQDSCDAIALELAEASLSDSGGVISTIANADEALKWVCGAVTIPDQHLHAFRDLVKLAQNYRNLVEKEMKAYHDARD